MEEELDPRIEKLPTAAEAREEVERLIIHFGPYRAPVYSCDLVRWAVRAAADCQEAARKGKTTPAGEVVCGNRI